MFKFLVQSMTYKTLPGGNNFKVSQNYSISNKDKESKYLIPKAYQNIDYSPDSFLYVREMFYGYIMYVVYKTCKQTYLSNTLTF